MPGGYGDGDPTKRRDRSPAETLKHVCLDLWKSIVVIKGGCYAYPISKLSHFTT